ncbi:MAG: hypothetical protein ACXVWU_06920 [Nocardioides sp.]
MSIKRRSAAGCAASGVAALAAALLTGLAPSTPATASEPANVLSVGHQLTALTATDHLSSPSGEFTLTAEPDRVSLYEVIRFGASSEGDSFTTGTWFRDDGTGLHQSNTDRTTLRLQRNGNLVLRTASGVRLWSTRTVGSGATRLVLTDRGNLLLKTAAGTTVWSSGSGRVVIKAGATLGSRQRLVDAWNTSMPHGARATLTMQANGNLVHRCGTTVLWQTHTHTRRSRLQVTSTGAVRVVAPDGHVTWSSRSGKHSISTLFSVRGMELHQYSPTDRVVWHADEPWQGHCA